MSHFAQALSQLPDSHAAGREAAEAAHAALAGRAPDAVFVFCTDGYDADQVAVAVREVFGDAQIAGGTAPGVFSNGIVTHLGVAVTAAADSGLTVRPAAVPGVAAASETVSASAVEAALDALAADGAPTSGERAVMMLLPDGVSGNSVEVARGAVDVLGRETRVIGGGSGDDFKFARAQQICGGHADAGQALAIGIASASPIGVALRHGCHPVGQPMQATSVQGRSVTALDFGSAFDRYREAGASLGADQVTPDTFMQFAMLHPLGLVQAQGEHVLRSPLFVGEGGAVLCCSDIPQNALVRFMEGSDASMLAATTEAAEAAKAQLGGRKPAAALVFACVSRDGVVGVDEAGLSREIAAVQHTLGPDVAVFGCLTFGGFGTLGTGLPQYHSKSVNVSVFAEA